MSFTLSTPHLNTSMVWGLEEHQCSPNYTFYTRTWSTLCITEWVLNCVWKTQPSILGRRAPLAVDRGRDSPEYMSHKWREWVFLENFLELLLELRKWPSDIWHEWTIATMSTRRLNADNISQTAQWLMQWSYIFVRASMPIYSCFQKEEGENWKEGKTCIPTINWEVQMRKWKS